MGLEIYNTTNNTLEVPKFNYSGKITLGAKESYPIEERMAKFYKPWATIGVAVRKTFNDEKVEAEVEKVIAEPVAETVEEVKEEEVVVDTPVAEEKTMEVKYTAESLANLKLKELKEIASAMGIEVADDVNRKSTVADMILEAQNK